MAERRMFAKTIIDSDAFLDMPLSAQALYFHLSMRADDDGFVNNPKKIQRMVGASDDDCKLLILKRFILTFESGVIVIKHWKIHNYIQKDRYKETVYLKEKSELAIDENNSYTERIQNVSKLDTQVSIGKDRVSIDKNRVCLFDNYNILQNNISESEEKQASKQANEPIDFYGAHKNIGLTGEQYKELAGKYSYAKQVINSLSEYKYKKGITGTVKDYDVLLEWLEKDKGRYEDQPGSFETDDFFEAALKRSYRR